MPSTPNLGLVFGLLLGGGGTLLGQAPVPGDASPVPASLRSLEPASLAMVYDKAPSPLSGPAAGGSVLGSAGGTEATGTLQERAWRLPRPGEEALKGRYPGPGSATPPWIDASRWEVPSTSGYDVFEGTRSTSCPWARLEESLDKSNALFEPPFYSGVEPRPLFYVRTPRETEFARKLRKVARLKLLRELRHRAKREWADQFVEDPSLSFAKYQERLYLINNLGRESTEVDAFNAELAAMELKQGFLGKKRVDGESDIDLISWGPFTVTDTGSMKLNLGRFAHSFDDDEAAPLPAQIDVGSAKSKPLIATKDYQINTCFNLDLDPFLAASQGDTFSAVRRYGVAIEVDWLSDVLGREMVSTELEVESDAHGDFKGFFNIVIKSR
jgi:hypothetical protein